MDLSASELRGYARREKDPRVARRMLAIANALDGMSRALSARLAGMDRQALRDWVIRYNESRPHTSLGWLTPAEFASSAGVNPGR
ncbi:MAG: integrase core domain-containing protein [Zavarzinia sp.]